MLDIKITWPFPNPPHTTPHKTTQRLMMAVRKAPQDSAPGADHFQFYTYSLKQCNAFLSKWLTNHLTDWLTNVFIDNPFYDVSYSLRIYLHGVQACSSGSATNGRHPREEVRDDVNWYDFFSRKLYYNTPLISSTLCSLPLSRSLCLSHTHSLSLSLSLFLLVFSIRLSWGKLSILIYSSLRQCVTDLSRSSMK